MQLGKEQSTGTVEEPVEEIRRQHEVVTPGDTPIDVREDMPVGLPD